MWDRVWRGGDGHLARIVIGHAGVSGAGRGSQRVMRIRACRYASREKSMSTDSAGGI